MAPAAADAIGVHGAVSGGCAARLGVRRPAQRGFQALRHLGEVLVGRRGEAGPLRQLGGERGCGSSASIRSIGSARGSIVAASRAGARLRAAASGARRARRVAQSAPAASGHARSSAAKPGQRIGATAARARRRCRRGGGFGLRSAHGSGSSRTGGAARRADGVGASGAAGSGSAATATCCLRRAAPARGSVSAAAGGAPVRPRARRTRGAHDIGFDHDVGRTADHQEMLDIVAADQDEPAASVDRCRVDHGEPRLASARRAAPSRSAPKRRTSQAAAPISAEHDDEGDEEVHRSGISTPKRVSNIAPPCAPGAAPRLDPETESPEWLTPAAIFAAQNTNKSLTPEGRPLPLIRGTSAHFLGKRRINGTARLVPAFNRPLTIHPAKSAEPVRRALRSGVRASQVAGPSHGDLQHSAVLDAAHPDAVASGAPAPAGRERRQCRHAAVPAARSGAAEIRPAAAGRRLAGVARTNPAHLAGSAAATRSSGSTAAAASRRGRAGNAVSLEDEMIKVAANQMDYQAATTLYTRSLGLIKTAIGKR